MSKIRDNRSPNSLSSILEKYDIKDERKEFFEKTFSYDLLRFQGVCDNRASVALCCNLIIEESKWGNLGFLNDLPAFLVERYVDTAKRVVDDYIANGDDEAVVDYLKNGEPPLPMI